MARIVDAQKVELLRNLTIEEYRNKIDIRVNSDNSATINVEVLDPAVTQRKQLRAWAEDRQSKIAEIGQDPSDDLTDLIAELDRADKAAEYTYGENKGQPRPIGVVFYLDTETVLVLANLFSADHLTMGISGVIHKALVDNSPAVNTRGF